MKGGDAIVSRMSRSEERLPEEWLDALDDALRAFGDLVVSPSVAATWTNLSCLDGYTIGGIGGHVLSLVIGLQLRLEADHPEHVAVVHYEDWYRTAVVSAPDAPLHTGLIEVGEKLAAQGPHHLGAELDRTSGTLISELRSARRDRPIPLASMPGAGVPLEDFTRTRFVEILVHADDIAASAGIACPRFSPTAWLIAASVVSETSGVSGAGPQYVLQTCRPGRTQRIAADWSGES